MSSVQDLRKQAAGQVKLTPPMKRLMNELRRIVRNPVVEAAYNEGILPACNDTPPQFCPNDPLPRDWAAFMMVQAKGGLPLQ